MWQRAGGGGCAVRDARLPCRWNWTSRDGAVAYADAACTEWVWSLAIEGNISHARFPRLGLLVQYHILYLLPPRFIYFAICLSPFSFSFSCISSIPFSLFSPSPISPYASAVLSGFDI